MLWSGAFAAGFMTTGVSVPIESRLDTLRPSAEIAVVVPAVALLAASIVGLFGLFLLRHWGRTLSLWSTVIGIALLPAFGTTVAGGWEFALHDASSVLWGAILAAAYLSPLSGHFRRGATPVPLAAQS